jgi:hypothetical protein
METNDRQVLNAKLGELMYRALVTMRNATNPATPGEPERRSELNDLADLLHNIPRFIVGHDEHAIDSFEQFRGAVIDHVRRFFPSIDPAKHMYIQLLDMDEEVFLARYRDHKWNWPEPEPVA